MADLRPILLAEDSPRDAELTLAALDKCQLCNDVVVVRDGVEVLDYLRGKGKFASDTVRDPAVILLDLKMPKINGIEVLEQIRADAELRHIPVVMLTSSREEKDVVRSYELGVNAFVVKPVDFREFFQAVQDLGMFWAILNEPPPATRFNGAGKR